MKIICNYANIHYLRKPYIIHREEIYLCLQNLLINAYAMSALYEISLSVAKVGVQILRTEIPLES